MIQLKSPQLRIFNGSGEELKKSILLNFFVKFSNLNYLMEIYKIKTLIFLNILKIYTLIH